MASITLANDEQTVSEVKKVGEHSTSVRMGGARMRELTPAQRRAVMFAQQQVLRARAAKKAKDERQAALARMWQEEDAETTRPRSIVHKREVVGGEVKEASLREAIGHVLRELRTRDHKTLREVSEKAGVSLGYLSEVERGQKEASSELLASISEALGLTTSQMLRLVADYLDSVEV
ncbi:helix-turn-helix domain-containing protein [Bifidobacterium choloepi]|uniref:Helix-turn-helix transcriptional regulator n=1 Tax=Bifidobacterium choloepi TaxID=2614131 RepID=A0A6I5N0Y7_9BIFI|nr:helix-turn-helix transcriptional regulator [Bifidobacterium choloepi]NEG70126.1 helix-turn-helix transcriptional regulator [Bifidobacterium choloepi]